MPTLEEMWERHDPTGVYDSPWDSGWPNPGHMPQRLRNEFHAHRTYARERLKNVDVTDSLPSNAPRWRVWD